MRNSRPDLSGIGISNLIKIANEALINGIRFGLDHNYNVHSIKISNHSLLIDYSPTVKNNIAIYSGINQIMCFISSFMGNELKKEQVSNIGVQAIVDQKPYLYVISPFHAIEFAEKGDAITWLKNSMATEHFLSQVEVHFFVEGDTEVTAFPYLFENMGYPLQGHRIKLMEYAQMNLKTALQVMKYKELSYYLLADKDKKDIIEDLKREGYFQTNCHILTIGEFEDYIHPEGLVQILNKLTPGLEITSKDIIDNRERGKNTSRIINDLYFLKDKKSHLPSKPEIGKEIALYWVENGIPEEIQNIINEVMNIT
jgi:hypothetical protein